MAAIRPNRAIAYSNLFEVVAWRITVISSKQSNPEAGILCVSG